MIAKILNYGKDKLKNPEGELRYLQRSNFFIFFIFCIVPIFIPIFLWVGAGWHSWLLIGVSLNVLLVFYLNGIGRSFEGRVIQLITFCLWLLYFCWLLGSESGIQYLFIVFVTMPFVFFPSRFIVMQLLVVGLYAIGFILADGSVLEGPRILEQEANITFKVIVEILTFFWLTINFYYLNYTSDAYEKRMLQVVDRLELASKESEQFVYIASHDLQEPLRSTKSFLTHLKGEGVSKDGQTYQDYMEMLLTRMQSLIEALMNYGRLGQNSKLEFTDVRVLVANIKTDLSKMISDSGAIIEVGDMPVIKAYSTELRLMFQNLITNAIKFRKPGQIPEVIIQAKARENAWVFSIKDNGIGIDSKFHEKIFRIFQRLHTREVYDGLGVGLAHCKKIVDLHEGSIWLNSVLGEGTTFYISIPNKK